MPGIGVELRLPIAAIRTAGSQCAGDKEQNNNICIYTVLNYSECTTTVVGFLLQYYY